MLKLKIVPKITNDWTIQEVATKCTPVTWEKVFESAKYEIEEISELLEEDRHNGRQLPDRKNTFRVFSLVPLNKIRVVLVGQDPYHTVLGNGNAQAMGMSFSVPKEAPIPPSLVNIYKEIKSSIPEFKIPSHGDLTNWCLQGVFLLNMCLTVRQGEAGSHGKIWLGFIKKVVLAIIETNPNVIFVLWGKEAQNLKKILGNRVTILESSHPSPLGCYRGFSGCGHFKQINEMLKENPIDWNL